MAGVTRGGGGGGGVAQRHSKGMLRFSNQVPEGKEEAPLLEIKKSHQGVKYMNLITILLFNHLHY